MTRVEPASQWAGTEPRLRILRDAFEPPFERKFLVTEARARDVVAWAAHHLRPDPHAAPCSGGAYRVTSLYLDTAGLAVYHRRGSYGRAKYRVRRYDDATSVFLERKCKVEGRVRKRRTLVGAEELAYLAGDPPPADWPARWFSRRVGARGLVPTCLVSYGRVAHVGDGPRGPIRLTVDRDFLGRPASRFGLPSVADGEALFAGQAVVELKFRGAMPAPFKALVREHGLIPAAASKYRSALVACDLDAGNRERFDA
jgi:hypothetical protein